MADPASPAEDYQFRQWPKTALLRQLPLGRYGTKDELADLALFFMNPASSDISGSLLRCEGESRIVGRGL